MSKISQAGRFASLFVGVVAGVAGVGALAALKRPLPKTSGNLKLAGLQGRVQVLRDRWGVPHIYAGNNHDLFMAQGYVHAQDRLWQMEIHRRTGHGQLAELFGSIALTSDRFIRVLGFSRIARQEAELLDPETRLILEAYVEGVNAYLVQNFHKLPLEFTLTRHKPRLWDLSDVLVWSKIMALNLSENWSSEVLRAQLTAALGAERAGELEPNYPDDLPLSVPEGAHYSVKLAEDAMRMAREAMAFTGESGMGQGSNAWVVGGQRSTTGRPLLANDPHLAISMPSLWYEVHLEGGDYAVSGASLPGLPCVVIGHNSRIAWGVTNAMTDVQDLFIERFDPNDPLRYEYQGGWERAELVRETIHVKGQVDPFIEEVRITRHGPIISGLVAGEREQAALAKQAGEQGVGAAHALAMRWTALEPGTILRSAVYLNKARNWDEFRAALADWNVPPQNFVYADVDGHFGYVLAGAIPIRKQGDGRLPAPGWTGDYDWQGYIPHDEMPAAFDPEVGYAVTANNRIAGPNYPYHLSSDWLNGYRAARIRELLEAKDRHDAQSFAHIHQDQLSLPGLAFVELAPRLRADSAIQRAARDALAKWDGALSAESVGGTIYATLRYHLQIGAMPEVGKPSETVVGLGTFAVLPSTMYLERALPDILRRIKQNDDAWLGEGRTWQAVLDEAWQLTIQELETTLGSDVGHWRYGRIHNLSLRHILGSVPALVPVFNRGPWPTGGDVDTVCMGNQHRDTAAGPVYVAPSYRQICDTADWDNSRSIIPSGQSGQPGSGHYSDQAQAWREGEYHPMLWSRNAVEAATVSVLNLDAA